MIPNPAFAAAGLAEVRSEAFVTVLLLLLASSLIACLAYVGLQTLLEVVFFRSQISLKQILVFMFAVAIATAFYLAVCPRGSP